jgi:hypothetical protein
VPYLLVDQVAQEQDIASGQRPHALLDAGIHRAAEAEAEQCVGLGLRQRLQLQSLNELVLPQRGDGVGYRLTGAHAHDDRRLLLQSQLVKHKGRELIEQVSVIDGNDNAMAVG